MFCSPPPPACLTSCESSYFIKLIVIIQIKINSIDLFFYVDFDRKVIVVHQAKGNEDRVVLMPRSLLDALRHQLPHAHNVWEKDRQTEHASAEVPNALEMKYLKVRPSWGWFWLFPAQTLSVDPRSGVELRHHVFGKNRWGTQTYLPPSSTTMCSKWLQAPRSDLWMHCF